jgi:hypothetical protein
VARPHTSVASLFAARFRVCFQPNPRPRGLQDLRDVDAASSEKIGPRQLTCSR